MLIERYSPLTCVSNVSDLQNGTYKCHTFFTNVESFAWQVAPTACVDIYIFGTFPLVMHEDTTFTIALCNTYNRLSAGGH